MALTKLENYHKTGNVVSLGMFLKQLFKWIALCPNSLHKTGLNVNKKGPASCPDESTFLTSKVNFYIINRWDMHSRSNSTPVYAKLNVHLKYNKWQLVSKNPLEDINSAVCDI